MVATKNIQAILLKVRRVAKNIQNLTPSGNFHSKSGSKFVLCKNWHLEKLLILNGELYKHTKFEIWQFLG